VFQGFGQAKFQNGGLVLGFSQFSILPPKNTVLYKGVQNRPKKIILLC